MQIYIKHSRSHTTRRFYRALLCGPSACRPPLVLPLTSVGGTVDAQALDEAGHAATDHSPLEGEGDLECNSTDISGTYPNLSLFKFVDF